MGATRQFRSAGPMVLPPCTEAELARLKQAVKTSSKIKFLAMYPGKKGGVMILAQAREKLSPAKWRESIHPRLTGVRPAECMRTALEDARGQEGFEEFGRFSRQTRVMKSKAQPEALTEVQDMLEVKAKPMISTSGVHEMLLKARQSFLETIAVFFQPPGKEIAVGGLAIRGKSG
jgi:hypothetical protein